jgi:hypothetical protein
MYIKLTNGHPEIYSIGQLRRDNPQVSFPKTPTNELLADYGVFPYTIDPQPSYTETQVLEDGGIVQNGEGAWVQTWTVRDMTTEEIANLNRGIESNRRSAYQQEADPLYFMWKRGDATEEEWLAKIEEIKSRYPYY